MFANNNGQPVLGTAKVTTHRRYERDSEDHFDSHHETTWTLLLDGNGGLNFAKSDAFTNTVSGELTETDTRTLTNATLLPGYTGSSLFSVKRVQLLGNCRCSVKVDRVSCRIGAAC